MQRWKHARKRRAHEVVNLRMHDTSPPSFMRSCKGRRGARSTLSREPTMQASHLMASHRAPLRGRRGGTSIHSRKMRMKSQIASSSEPKAIVPRLYRSTCSKQGASEVKQQGEEKQEQEQQQQGQV